MAETVGGVAVPLSESFIVSKRGQSFQNNRFTY